MINRRSFLRVFGLAGAGIGLAPAAAGSMEVTRQDQAAGLHVKGKVKSGNKGLSNVVVSDGHDVVTTDSEGNYHLQAHPDAEFVHISIPRGFVIPNQKGIAQFYQSIKGRSGEVRADFSLEKLAADDEKHLFVVWADTQVISQEDVALLKSQSAPDLSSLVKSYPETMPVHAIGCGDLVWDKFELFPGYKEAVALTGVTFFNVIGNHDMDIDARSDDASANTFKKEFGPTYYSFNRGRIHYVVLDDVFFIGTGKRYIGYIPEVQLKWLEKDLSLVKPGSTVVVSLHIPTNTGAIRRTKQEEDFGGTVSNRKQLYKILSPFNVHIMSGHTHFNESWEEGNMMEHNHGTVCGAWWTGPVCGDGTPNGYGVYEVNGDDMRWYYKATGESKDYQLRIYPKGQSRNDPDEITVNVWNWDAKWKVEWFEDGVSKGPMLQRVGIDPLAQSLYGGPNYPKKHKFVEPTLTDHLFYAKPSAGAKELTVKATDRFGNVFVENIKLTEQTVG